MFNIANEQWLNDFQISLLTWFKKASRDLPWRGSKDPYRIWISEIMLQQTQVQQVLSYYQNFIRLFPDIQSLAHAPLSDVLKAWEGMGYYARARNLHSAAQIIVYDFTGRFPDDLKTVGGLPGVGPYTAAAILSIAYGLNHAVVDGNVRRVLCRLFAIETDPKSTAGKKQLDVLAQRLLARGEAGLYNEAIMELGATICTPAGPKCEQCPVAIYCTARATNRQMRYPIKTPRKARPHRIIAAGIIWHGDKILIARRPENGLLGGLWEFPGGKVEENERPEQAVIREIKEELDVLVSVRTLFAAVDHGYTHFTITLHAFHCDYRSGDPKSLGCSEWRWVESHQLKDFAFPRANTKIIEKLLL